jgi:hypothetical protein
MFYHKVRLNRIKIIYKSLSQQTVYLEEIIKREI